MMAEESDPDSWWNPLIPVVCTTEAIASGKRPILLVIHTSGHAGWQLYDGADVSRQRIVIMTKEDALAMDPTLRGIQNLRVGWQARRKSPDDEWLRSEWHGPE
jgi:hypothetical protein